MQNDETRYTQPSQRYDDPAEVSPIFNERRERSYLSDQGERRDFDSFRDQQQESRPAQQREDRVYRDNPFEEERNQQRRGFAPDVPSFLRRK